LDERFEGCVRRSRAAEIEKYEQKEGLEKSII